MELVTLKVPVPLKLFVATGVHEDRAKATLVVLMTV